MKTIALSLAVLSATLAGCASAPMATEPGKFYSYSCEGNKHFSARFNDAEQTVRVRTDKGSAELIANAEGYAGAGYALKTKDKREATVDFASKPLYTGCKLAQH